ncbi:unnamed protein product [Protopolystoma xenopodis]|uniref:Uncharacterized protein n=1 Tax=Protopolystoma xenopodis TaxID=117903 RepID=A0A448X1Z6_9PLAT|nr:unnamed protein product [Protopolystoma xenopodis]
MDRRCITREECLFGPDVVQLNPSCFGQSRREVDLPRSNSGESSSGSTELANTFISNHVFDVADSLGNQSGSVTYSAPLTALQNGQKWNKPRIKEASALSDTVSTTGVNVDGGGLSSSSAGTLEDHVGDSIWGSVSIGSGVPCPQTSLNVIYQGACLPFCTVGYVRHPKTGECQACPGGQCESARGWFSLSFT